ncbi:MAG TPA: response regulator, partial [Polyangia bacterium]
MAADERAQIVVADRLCQPRLVSKPGVSPVVRNPGAAPAPKTIVIRRLCHFFKRSPMDTRRFVQQAFARRGVLTLIAFPVACYQFGLAMDGDRRLLLLVEDDLEVAETLDDFLTDDGFRIVKARNGREALEQLRGGLRPSAILLDLVMPEMDGWQFRREQVADADLRSIATII